MEPLNIRNRKIIAEDLPVIQAVVSEYWNRGRTHISREVCEYWYWVQPGGRLKDMACQELLLTLHRKGLVDYPSSRFTPKNIVRTTARICVDQTPLNCTLKELDPVRVEMVRYTEYECIFSHYICWRLLWSRTGSKVPATGLRTGPVWERPRVLLKKGHKHLKHDKIKDVYVYPLDKHFKKLLNR